MEANQQSVATSESVDYLYLLGGAGLELDPEGGVRNGRTQASKQLTDIPERSSYRVDRNPGSDFASRGLFGWATYTKIQGN